MHNTSYSVMHETFLYASLTNCQGSVIKWFRISLKFKEAVQEYGENILTFFLRDRWKD